MAVANGYGKVATSGSVFMYDTGDTINSYRGEPTTNLALYSNDITNGVWLNQTSNVTSTNISSGGPFNNSYIRLTVGSSGYQGRRVQVGTGTNPTIATFSIYLRGSGNCSISLYNGVGIDLPTTTLTNTWTRYSVSVTGGSGGYYDFSLQLYGGSIIDVSSAQVEGKSHATPYIGTTNETSTRSATQGLLPVVGNSTIDLSNMSYNSNAQMYFDGTDDYIDTTKNASDLGIYDAPYTMESVFKITNTISGDNMVFGTNQTNYRQGLHNGVRNGVIYFAHYSADYAAGSVALNEIVHIAWVYDGTTAFIYKNGILQGSASIASFIGTTNIQIGKSWAYFQGGEIPIAKIYNRALSAAEIKQNYNKYKTRFNLA